MTAAIVQGNRHTPWYGIGVAGEWGSSFEALTAAGLDFTVRQERLHWNLEDNGIVYEQDAPMFGNVRDTDDRLLGCVTPQYKLIQNVDAFSLIDPFLGNNGVITHAGMTEDGLVFMVAEVGVEAIGGDEYVVNLMCTNSFNTRYPCQVIMTPVRIICQNMYRKIVNDRIFMAKHTMAANNRLKQIAQGGTVEKRVLAFSNVMQQASIRSMSLAQMRTLLAMLFPYPKEKGPREQAYIDRADRLRREFEDVYYDAPDNRAHHGTAVGFIHAYFDYLSHRNPVRNTQQAWNDRRLQGIVSGLDIDMGVLRQAL